MKKRSAREDYTRNKELHPRVNLKRKMKRKKKKRKKKKRKRKNMKWKKMKIQCCF
jgi:hypothetical protein